MAEDLFGGLGKLGGLMKGLSSFMPQDDPNTKIFNAQNELNELKQRELELYAEIGKRVIKEVSTLPEFAEIIDELHSNREKQQKIADKLRQAEEEKKEKELREEEQRASLTCPNCDTINPENFKFCQECGTKLGIALKSLCPQCGTKNPPQTRFCGECGCKLNP